MNRREHLLSCLAEECTEVGQRVSKALRFGEQEIQPGQPLTNVQRIHGELLDLLAVWKILVDEGVLPVPPAGDEATVLAKRAKVEKFMRYAEEQGALIASSTTPRPTGTEGGSDAS